MHARVAGAGAAVIAVSMAAAGPAVAQSNIFSAGTGFGLKPGAYLEVGGVFGHMPLHNWVRPYVRFGTATRIVDRDVYRIRLAPVGAAGALGYVFAPGVLPRWLGANPRLAYIAAFWGDDLFFLSGDPAALGDGPTRSMFQTLDVSYDEWEMTLRLGSDWPLSPDLTLTTSLAVFGGKRFTRYLFNTHGLNGGNAPVNAYRLYERVAQRSIGGLAGLRLTWRASYLLAFHIATAFAYHRTSASLHANDCLSTAITDVCGPDAAVLGTLNVRRAAHGFRGRVGLGASVRIGIATLTVSGFIRLDTAMATVKNTGIANLGTGQVPARLSFDDIWVMGGKIELRLPLGRWR